MNPFYDIYRTKHPPKALSFNYILRVFLLLKSHRSCWRTGSKQLLLLCRCGIPPPIPIQRQPRAPSQIRSDQRTWRRKVQLLFNTCENGDKVRTANTVEKFLLKAPTDLVAASAPGRRTQSF